MFLVNKWAPAPAGKYLTFPYSKINVPDLLYS